MEGGSVERLMRIFSSLLAPMAIGCGPELSELDHAQFTEDLCDEGQTQIVATLEPAEDVDYIELRYSELRGANPLGPESYSLELEDAAGERCGGAQDPAACDALLEGLPRDSDFGVPSQFGPSAYRSLAWTRADEVHAIRNLEELQRFIGIIDAPADAALWAMMSGYTLRCEGNDVGVHPMGYVVHTTRGSGCPSDVQEQAILVRPDGGFEVLESAVVEAGDPGCAAGRMPAGYRPSRYRTDQRDPVGSWWAEQAQLEAASVTAFDQLAGELEAHRAPASFARQARRSREDEIRHARVMSGLARRYRGQPVAPHVTRWAPRPLVDVAVDNAVEGCIRETFGALVAHVQAQRARDPLVRRVLNEVAADETRHAALSWCLAGWIEPHLSVASRRVLRRRSRRALEELESTLTPSRAQRVHELTGLPDPGQARALYRGLRRALWS